MNPRPLPLLLAFLALASPSMAALVNRWSFNQPAGAAGAGLVINDSLAGMPLTVRGLGATLDGSRIVLPGTTTSGNPNSTISAYLDLPNGLVSSKSSITVEIWAAPIAVRNWQPLFEFGRMDIAGDGLGAPGEWTGNGNTGPAGSQGSDLLGCSFNQNLNLNSQYQVVMINGGFQSAISSTLATTAGQTYHYAITVQGNGATCSTAWYRNGQQVGTGSTPFALSAIEDVNCWLGRSQWAANSTSNATYDELRIYNHAFTPTEAASSFATGPNPAPPSTLPDAATMHHGQKVRIPVLTNDTGIITPGSIVITAPPSSGTAVVSGEQILYTHTSGTPATDSFAYRISGPGGNSNDALVSLTFSSSLRIPNATLNVPNAPPPTTYQTAPAFGALTFDTPINLAAVPGDSQRLFVVERPGVIRLIPSVTAPVPTSQVFLNIATLCSGRGETLATTVDRGLMSIAFHPQHSVNGRFFVWYSVVAGGQNYYRISRFTTQAGNPNLANPASEVVLLQQLEPNGYHLGSDMHFGNDGYLYISTGDGGGQNDGRRYGQRIDLNFHCALLRIDVDKLPGNPEPNLHSSVPRDGGIARYSVPANNPYVTANPNVAFNGVSLPAANVRTEFFSIGLRNPFRFSIDATTGEIWLGDVGQNAREEVNLAANGANFGWSWREGTIAGPNAGEALPGFTYTNPLYEYSSGNGQFQGHSVTGGIVYRGPNLPALTGAYIFGDYQDGNLWALRRNGAQTTIERLTGNAGQVAFHADPSNGDVLMVDIQENRILRLIAGTDTGSFPSTLSATNLFADLSTLSPAPGLLPYTPNLSFWSDHAIKQRWFIVPDALATMTWTRDDAWTYPDGTIWVKHFDLETTRGNPATAQRIETRLLVKNATGSYGVSYRWNPAQTEATIVADAGADFPINVIENGIPRIQNYRIPSRSQCLTCHNPAAGHALSFNTRQLNLSENIHGFTGNQLDLLTQAGYFSNTPVSPNLLPRHLRPTETAFPVEARVRSYLDVNCANCHRSGGNAPASWDGRAPLTLAGTSLIHGSATNNGGDILNRLIVPGDPSHSIVLSRVSLTNGFTRMPPLGSNELDQTAIALLTEWISTALPAQQTYAQWRLAQFGSAVSAIGEPSFDADLDGHSNYEEFLVNTAPQNVASFFTPSIFLQGNAVTLSATLPANRSCQIETSTELGSWQLWDVPGNGGLPTTPGPVNFTGPASLDRQFFRFLLREN